MVSKGRHPKKPIADALATLDAAKFTVEEIHKGHRWGSVTCNHCGDSVSVWSTPRVPENNAKTILVFAAQHEHEEENEQL